MNRELARVAYEAHAGDDSSPPAIPWDRLPEKTRQRWRRTVHKTLEAASGAGALPVEPGTADGDDRYG